MRKLVLEWCDLRKRGHREIDHKVLVLVGYVRAWHLFGGFGASGIHISPLDAVKNGSMP